MKGIIFTTLADMVQDKYGLEMWDKLLLEVNPPSEGAYTAGTVYPDSELFALLACLSKMTNLPINDLLNAYGEYLFEKLLGYFPNLVPEHITLKEFLLTINDIIHVEVKKMHPNAELPRISYENPAADQLVMLYQSPRKLCPLAMGLMKGAAKHYQASYHISESLCMHKGADHCRFELQFPSK